VRLLSNIKNGVSLLINFIRLAQNPERTPLVIKIVDTFQDMGLYAQVVRKLRDDPRTSAVLDQRRHLTWVDPAEFVKKYPAGSLGHRLGSMLLEKGYDGNYFRVHDGNVDELYAARWTGETHDIWHLATSFDTSFAGELGLQAFMMRQLRTPQSTLFLAGGLLRCLFKEPSQLEPVMNAVVRGWWLGSVYPPLFAMNWETSLSTQLDDLVANFLKGKLPVGDAGHVGELGACPAPS
jgi:ubiquinone biosynthesis protein Coq4